MLTRPPLLPVSLGLVALCALTPAVEAQNARVASANSSNGKILEITFNPPGSAQLNTDANTHVSLQSILFREDGAQGIHILAADASAGEVLFYDNGVGNSQVILDGASPGAPEHPDGLSQDAARNLFGVARARKRSDRGQVEDLLGHLGHAVMRGFVQALRHTDQQARRRKQSPETAHNVAVEAGRDGEYRHVRPGCGTLAMRRSLSKSSRSE